jgi:Uma2 family endonuclease
MAVTPKRMSLTEFLKLPEVKPALELRNGVVRQRGYNTGPGSAIMTWLAVQIHLFAEPRELAQAFISTRIILGDESYVPNLVVCLWDRVPLDRNGMYECYFRVAPDLAVEILAADEQIGSLMTRGRELVGHHVRVVLLIDPGGRSIYVLRAEGEVGPLRDGDTIDITDVLPGFELTASDLFARVRARPPRSQSQGID